VLPAGAALGFGCGPLVVCRHDSSLQLDELATARVAIPGRFTTAFLLLSSFAPPPRECVVMPFDRVMPAVAAGDCDAGLVIHEGRFTYAAHGLRELADLGVLWERTTDGPLPLGVIAARRDLDEAVVTDLGELLRRSVAAARRAPERPRAYVRAFAQELDDDVCDRHIALYVNDSTEDLGAKGRQAIEALLARGRNSGLLPVGPSPFREGT
jgi:1,4-dihydroxy-6-naphthoate synthase